MERGSGSDTEAEEEMLPVHFQGQADSHKSGRLIQKLFFFYCDVCDFKGMHVNLSSITFLYSFVQSA